MPVLERALDAVMASGLVGEQLTIVWHSGEPLAVAPQFYESARESISAHMTGVNVNQSLQTNATLIDDRWCEIFLRCQIKIGVSIDGPSFIHDKHRVDRNGNGTHAAVLRGIEVLQRNRVPFHTITVVTADALDYPDELVDFFVEAGIEQVGFNFEEVEAANTESTISPSHRGRIRAFWQRIYDRNVAMGQPLRIREFARALAAITSKTLPDRTRMGNDQARPFGIVSIDSGGNMSTFSPELLGATSDRFQSFVFSNICDSELIDVLASPLFTQVAREVAEGVAMCASSCDYFRFCGGGAPVNKLYENGTFASTETMYCVNSIQLPIQVVLDDLERQLELTEPGSEKAAGPIADG